ncbi:MAG: cell division protein ZipA [Gammaproteobacteria bacterium]
MDENFPLILLAISLVVIILVIFAVQRKKRQTQLRASMYRQWRDYPNDPSIKPHPSTGLGSTVDAVDVEHILDDAEIISETRIIKPVRDFVIFYVMAKSKQSFVGYELLQALSAAGLQYGEMNIFHHYNEDKKSLFSLASASEPGTFDLSEMGGVQCKGLCIFMDAKRVEQPQHIFETMLSTVKQLAEDLGGVIQDQKRRALTEQCISVYRARLRTCAKA